MSDGSSDLCAESLPHRIERLYIFNLFCSLLSKTAQLSHLHGKIQVGGTPMSGGGRRGHQKVSKDIVMTKTTLDHSSLTNAVYEKTDLHT
jgi:hypothetical protein